jgi:hypothetical protein
VTRPVTPEPDATDTASFISENDLPDWIRQIAEADAAKKAEADRLAAQPAPAAEAAAPKRVVLPGETAPSVPAVNPWLTRRDGPTAASSWGAAEPAVPAQAEPPPVEPVALAAQAEEVDFGAAPAAPAPATRRGPKLSLPSVSTPTLPKFTMPSLKRSGDGASSPQQTRTLLLAAVVVLLLIVVALSML